MSTSKKPVLSAIKSPLRVIRFAVAIAVALGCAQVAHATPLDLRVAWNYDGISAPSSYAPNPAAADFNEILVKFANQNQTGGHLASNLDDAITFAPTGVGVTWAGWRRENANDPAAFSSDILWVDRAGTASQLTGNDNMTPTTSSITFTGLVPGNHYIVEVVMTGYQAASPWNVSINSANANTTRSGGQLGSLAAWNPETNGSQQNDWLIWNGANSAVATGGSLTIDFYNAASHGMDGLHAIRITGEIPEPATMSLLVLGGLAALIRRKNSNR